MKFQICPVCGCYVPLGRHKQVEFSPEAHDIIDELRHETDSKCHYLSHYFGDAFSCYRGHSCSVCNNRSSDADLITIDTDKPIHEWYLPPIFNKYIITLPGNGYDTRVHISIKTKLSALLGSFLAIFFGAILSLIGYAAGIKTAIIIIPFGLLLFGTGLCTLVGTLITNKGYTLACSRGNETFSLGRNNHLKKYSKADWKVVLLAEPLTSVALVNRQNNKKYRLTGMSDIAHGKDANFYGTGDFSRFLIIYYVVCGLLEQDPACTPVMMWRLSLFEQSFNIIAKHNTRNDNTLKREASDANLIHNILNQKFGSIAEYEKRILDDPAINTADKVIDESAPAH